MDRHTKWTRTRLLVVGGGVLALIGFFLPWITVLGFLELSGAQMASMETGDQAYGSFQQAAAQEEGANGAWLWIVPACGLVVVLVGSLKQRSLFGLTLTASAVGLLCVAPFFFVAASEPLVGVGSGLIAELVGFGVALSAATQTRGRRVEPVPNVEVAATHARPTAAPRQVTPAVGARPSAPRQAGPIIDATPLTAASAARAATQVEERVAPEATVALARPFMHVAEIRNKQVVNEAHLAPGARIGRDPTRCKFVVLDSGASREHLEVRIDGNGWRVADVGSTNGTFMQQDGSWRPVPNSGVLVNDELVLAVGRTKLVLRPVSRRAAPSV